MFYISSKAAVSDGADKCFFSLFVGIKTTGFSLGHILFGKCVCVCEYVLVCVWMLVINTGRTAFNMKLIVQPVGKMRWSLKLECLDTNM